MNEFKINVVDRQDDIIFLQAQNGKRSDFKKFNAICNDLSIRFIPTNYTRAAPLRILPKLYDVLSDKIDLAGIEEWEEGDMLPLEEPCVFIRRFENTKMQFFLTGGRVNGELFDAYRQVMFDADVRFNRDWAAYIAEFSASKIEKICRNLEKVGLATDCRSNIIEEIELEKQKQLEGQKHIESLNETEQGRLLYPYQRDGITWLAQKRRSLLADEMGLGKTVQALMAIRKGVPILVICPAVAKGVWRVEAKKWRPDLCVEVLSGRGSLKWPEPDQLVVVNYDVLPDAIPEHCPKDMVLIADESHAVKNPEAKRTIRFKRLAETTSQTHGRIWLLTGTPLFNQPKDLWTLLGHAHLQGEAFGSWQRFKFLFGGEYVEVAKKVWSIQWGIPKPEVRLCLDKVMLRRTRMDVLQDLPPKRYQTLYVDQIDARTRRACASAEKALAKIGVMLSSDNDKELLAKLEKHRQIILGKVSAARKALSLAKMQVTLDVVTEHEAQETPLVVFSAFRPVIDALSNREGWAGITGDTSANERIEIQEAFQAGELLGVAATIKAGGMALTLTRAAHALFVDLEWTPALNIQAEDRLCRIGQKNSVLITQLIADVPIDNRVTKVLARKIDVLSASGL